MHAIRKEPGSSGTGSRNGTEEDSDVYLCKADQTKPRSTEASDAAAAAAVTLFVYGWHVVEPGPLSWVFPNLRAALAAARTMKNAAKWCIVKGEAWPNVEVARNAGAVLIEELGAS
jgi:hypothetical protein